MMSNSLVFWTNCGQDTHNVSTRKTNAGKIFTRAIEPPPTDFYKTYPLKEGDGGTLLHHYWFWVAMFHMEGVKCHTFKAVGFM
jgi:hypothetical protein